MVYFNYSPCKKGFGVYVKSLSGLALALMLPKLPELDPNLCSLASDIETKEPIKRGAIPVVSDRLYRFKDEKQAHNKVRELNTLSDVDAVSLIWGHWIRPIEKHYKLAKLQYFRLYREGMRNNSIMQFTSQDKTHVENISLYYTDNNVKNEIKKTIGRTVKLTPNEYDQIVPNADYKPAIPKGLKGITAPIGKPKRVRIDTPTRKYKATTSLTFWNKK